jgi:hypothetical protein
MLRHVEHFKCSPDVKPPLITLKGPHPLLAILIIADCLRYGYHCFRPRKCNATSTKEKGRRGEE